MKFFEQNEYQEKCSALFLKIKSEISTVLPSAKIEHIGSSSVPGVISKGDLDIYVGVDPQAHEGTLLRAEKVYDKWYDHEVYGYLLGGNSEQNAAKDANKSALLS
jgi:GrpB-like predicted nucleotidyltransferase (UPF0157 family)